MKPEQSCAVCALSSNVPPSSCALVALWSSALAACSGPVGSTSAPPLPVANEARVPSSTACVVRSPDADPGSGHYPPKADSITITGDDVRLCWDKPPARTCWRLDAATHQITPTATSSPPDDRAPSFPRSRATAEVHDDGTISLCAPGGQPCKPFANPGPPHRPEWVGVSDDLASVAIPDGEVLRIYDRAKAKLRATIKGWPDSPMAGNGFHDPPIFAGDHMIVWYSWSPVSEQGRIFDLAGKQLAIVGGKDFSVIDPDNSSWPIQGTEWATKGDLNSLVTVDLHHPEVTSTYDLQPLLAFPRPSPGNDFRTVEPLAVAGTADRLVIVTSENPVTIGVLDRRTRKLVKLEPPRCPP